MITDVQFTAWLNAETVRRLVLAELRPFVMGQGVRTRYLSNLGYITGPLDEPAHTEYEEAILEIPGFSTRLSEALGGRSQPAWGELIIDNLNGERDAWLEDAWDGRAIKLLIGDPSWRRADFRTILAGTCADISAPEPSRLAIAIRDKQWLLNVPVQTRLINEPELVSGLTWRVAPGAVTSIDAVYDQGVAVAFTPDAAAGTFDLARAPLGKVTAEITGGEADSEQPIPLAYGTARNVEPVLLHAGLLLYQVHDGAITAVDAVYDNGVALALTTGYTVDLAAGRITLVAAPAGRITADVRGDASAGSTVATIVERLLLARTQLTAADIDSGNLYSFNVACPQTVGLYIRERRNLMDVLDELVTSVGGWYGFSRSGTLRLGRLTDPATAPSVLSVEEGDIVERGVRVRDRRLPLATVRLGYRRNWTVQDGDGLAASVTAARRAVLELDALTVAANAEAVKGRHLLAREPDRVLTALDVQSQARTEARRRLTLEGAIRLMLSVEAFAAPFQLEIGSVITLTHPRFGCAAGRKFAIVGLDERAADGRITLELWG